MKRIIFSVLMILFVSAISICAVADASDARQDWLDAKEITREKRQIHQDAKLDLAADRTDENREAVVDTGKDFLNAVLDEAELWLDWKKIESEENSRIPDELRERIADDVAANKDKVDELRDEVDAVTNQIELGVVSLKMIGKYFELLSDVSRNSGLAWVEVANNHADRIEEIEGKVRNAAEKIDDNDDIIEKLDNAREEIEKARENIDKAEDAYKAIEIGRQPFMRHREGNMHLRAARQNMLMAHTDIRQSFRLIMEGSR